MLTLSQETEDLIERVLAKGHYASADELIHTAIDMWNAMELEQERIREGIAEGIAQIERGEFVSGKQFAEEILALEHECLETAQ